MNRTFEALTRHTDFLLPEKAKKTRAEKYSANVLIMLVLLNSFLCLAIQIALWIATSLPALILTMPTLVMYLTILLFFRLSGRYTLSANLFCLTAYIPIAIGIAFSGNYVDGTLFTNLLVVVPVYAVLLMGHKAGLIWTFIIVVTCAVYFLAGLDHMRIDNVSLLNSYQSSVLNYFSWSLMISVVMISLISFDALNRQLQAFVNQERDSFARDALHDGLTSLPNRVHFENRLKEAINIHAATGAQFAVAFIDLDRFKPINDEFGHAAGDYVLSEIGRRISGVVRRSDIAARLGGDEFAILFTSVGDEQCLSAIAEKIILKIEEEVVHNKKSLQVSASFGLAIANSNSNSLVDIMKRADEAMYIAKREGRRIVFA